MTPLCIGIDHGDELVVHELLKHFFEKNELPANVNGIQEEPIFNTSPLELAFNNEAEFGEDDKGRRRIVEMLIFSGALTNVVELSRKHYKMYRRLRDARVEFMKDYDPNFDTEMPWEYCARRWKVKKREKRKRKREEDGAHNNTAAASSAKKERHNLQLRF